MLRLTRAEAAAEGARLATASRPVLTEEGGGPTSGEMQQRRRRAVPRAEQVSVSCRQSSSEDDAWRAEAAEGDESVGGSFDVRRRLAAARARSRREKGGGAAQGAEGKRCRYRCRCTAARNERTVAAAAMRNAASLVRAGGSQGADFGFRLRNAESEMPLRARVKCREQFE